MTDQEKQALIAAGIEPQEVSEPSDNEAAALKAAGLSLTGEDASTVANYKKRPDF